MLNTPRLPRHGFVLPILGLATLALVAHDIATSRVLDRSYDTIAESLRNTIPSIIELSVVGRRLDDVARELDAIEPSGLVGPLSRERVRLALDDLARHERAYVALPASPMER